MKKAFEQDHLEANNWFANKYCQFGIAFYTGENKLEQNYERAFESFTRAAELGSTAAILMLGVLYGSGHGVEQSDELAYECYKKAAEQSQNHEDELQRMLNKLANQPLVECYTLGKGVEKNEDLAEKARLNSLQTKELQEVVHGFLESLMDSSPKSLFLKEYFDLKLDLFCMTEQFDEEMNLLKNILILLVKKRRNIGM